MSSRCAGSTGPAVLALSVAIGVVTAFGAPAARPASAATARSATSGSSSGSSAPLLSLASQSPWVMPRPGATATFTVRVTTAKGVAAGDEVVTTLYHQLTTRSGFEQTLTRVPTGRVLDRTHPVTLSSLPDADGGRGLSISVLPDAVTTPPAGGAPTLDLTCTPTTPGQCTGVYPLVVSLVRPASGGGSPTPVPHAHFTTYLTYTVTTSTHRLGFAWVVPVAAPVAVRHDGRSPARAVTAASPAEVASLSGLTGSLAAHSGDAATVAASPATLESLARSSLAAGPHTVQTLAAMSASGQPNRQFLAQPYVPIDLGALAGAGEGEEITAQMGAGDAVLRSLGVQTAPTSGTWVASGAVGSDLREGMSAKGLGATSLVLPDSDLAPLGTTQSRNTAGTWASAFTLALGAGGAPVTAAASDSGLAAHFTADPSDPALEANQLLADLAMIHFEEPNTPAPRAVVAVPPSGWIPSKAFDTALLTGLHTNPLVETTTLDGYFSTFHANGTPLTTRRLSTGGTGPVLPASLAHEITAQRLRLTAFDGSVRGNRTVLTRLDQLLLSAECRDLSSAQQTDGVSSFAGALDAQLSLVQLATERTITLTASSGLIPVTMVSGAPYTVVGVLTVSGGRFVFPHGDSQHLTLNHATTPVRVAVEARTSGDLPLEVTFASPSGKLVIASGRLTVRSTATSLVGVVLTVLALLVLLGWWARTWRRGRHRMARGAPSPDA